MANLDVQKKRKLSFPWILLVLILIAAGVLFYLNRDKIYAPGVTGSPAQVDSTGDSTLRAAP